MSASFTLDGEQYELDDFDLGELEWLEEYVQRPLTSIENFLSLKAASGLLYLVRKRKNPDLTIEEHRKLKATAIFGEPEPDEPSEDKKSPAAKRPPKPAAQS